MNKLTLLCIALGLLCLPACAQDAMPMPSASPGKVVKLKAGQGTVNINRATREELVRVPGIGESLATYILECRKENGRFSDWTSLMEVKGIGPRKLARLKPFLSL